MVAREVRALIGSHGVGVGVGVVSDYDYPQRDEILTTPMSLLDLLFMQGTIWVAFRPTTPSRVCDL